MSLELQKFFLDQWNNFFSQYVRTILVTKYHFYFWNHGDQISMALAIKYPKLSAGVLIGSIYLIFFQNCSRIPPPSASLKKFDQKKWNIPKNGLYAPPISFTHYLIFECFNFSGRYFVREADGSRILQDIQIFSSKKQPSLPN